MKRFVVVFLLVVLVPGYAHGLTICNFDNVPQTYWTLGGQQNLGNYYPGVTFGPKATIYETTV